MARVRPAPAALAAHGQNPPRPASPAPRRSRCSGGFVHGPALFLAAALSACGDPAEPPVPTAIEVSPSRVSFTAVGDTEQLRARVIDQYGKTMTNVNVGWSSRNPAVANVDTGTGLLAAAGNGSTDIAARAGTVAGEAKVTVRQEARRVEKARGDGQVGYVHEPLPVPPAVLVLDANGNPARDIAVVFAVTSGGGTASDTSVTTGQDGIAETGWTLGREAVQTLTAGTGGLTAVFRATRAPVTIVTDSLDWGRVTLQHSDTLGARGGTGEGYSWSLGGDGTLPRGLAIEPHGVVTGTPAEAGTFEFTVRVVDSEGGEDAADFEMRVCDGPLGLAVGDVRVFEPGDAGPCGIFVRAPEASAYYRVTVAGLDAASTQLPTTTLEVEGIPAGDNAAPRRDAGGLKPAPPPPRGLEAGHARALEIEAANDSLHLRIRREEVELYRRLAAEGRLGPMLDRAAAAAAIRGRTGAMTKATHTFRLRSSGCNVAQEVDAAIIAENDHLVVYEELDAESPVPVKNVDSVIDFYSDHGAEVIVDYFGGVSDVNGDEKIVVLINPTLEGVRGFVWSGDMTFTTDDCEASNEMELIHMSAGAFRFENNSRWAFSGMAHEAKHVSSLYKRVRGDGKRGGGNRFHPTWVEEGTAEIAKEMSSRIAWERGGGPDLDDRVTGDIMRVGLRENRVAVEGTFQLLARTVRAYSVNPNAVTFEPLGRGHVYGSGWHFHRLLRDRIMAGAAHPMAADKDFVTELNDSLTRSGAAGIVDVTGESIDDLLAAHATAMTVAGAESELADERTPRFLFYQFPTATEIFSNPDPPGRYPWPVTLTGDNDLDAVAAVELAETDTYAGQLGASGVRIHDLEAVREGDAAVFRIVADSEIRIIVARIPKPAFDQ